MTRPLALIDLDAVDAVQRARLSEGWCPMRGDGRLNRDGYCPDCGWWYRMGGPLSNPHGGAWTAHNVDPATIGYR